MQAVICTNWGSARKSEYLGICANNWTRQQLAGFCFQESSTLQLTMTPAPLCHILCCYTWFHFLLGPGMGHSNPRQRIKSEQKLECLGYAEGTTPNAYQLWDQGDTWGCIFACMSWQELGNFCWQELNNIALSNMINRCILLSTFQFCVYFLSSSPLRSSYKITTGPISGLPSAGAHRNDQFMCSESIMKFSGRIRFIAANVLLKGSTAWFGFFLLFHGKEPLKFKTIISELPLHLAFLK